MKSFQRPPTHLSSEFTRGFFPMDFNLQELPQLKLGRLTLWLLLNTFFFLLNCFTLSKVFGVTDAICIFFAAFISSALRGIEVH